jgi:hypothetical protein
VQRRVWIVSGLDQQAALRTGESPVARMPRAMQVSLPINSVRISGDAYSFVTFLFDELLELTAPAHLPS